MLNMLFVLILLICQFYYVHGNFNQLNYNKTGLTDLHSLNESKLVKSEDKLKRTSQSHSIFDESSERLFPTFFKQSFFIILK